MSEEKNLYIDPFARNRKRLFDKLSNIEKIEALKKVLHDLENCECKRALLKCHHDLLTDQTKIGMKRDLENHIKILEQTK